MDLNRPKLVTVFGGSGFVGTEVIQELAAAGYHIRVAVRRPDLAGHVRMFGAPGQVQPIQANVRFPDSVDAAVRGVDAVVNLVGISIAKGKQTFRAVNVIGAKTIAEAAKRHQVQTLVHVSALGADINSPSDFLSTKAQGESEVLKIYPRAIVIRPATIFGQDDRLVNIIGFGLRTLPFLCIPKLDGLIAPIFITDVAKAISVAVQGHVRDCTVYEIEGAQQLTVKDLIAKLNVETGRKRAIVEVPDFIANAFAKAISLLPNPMITPEIFTRYKCDMVVAERAKNEGRVLAAFGIVPKTIDAELPAFIWRFNRNGEFSKSAEIIAS